jgi:hypothetical protein
VSPFSIFENVSPDLVFQKFGSPVDDAQASSFSRQNLQPTLGERLFKASRFAEKIERKLRGKFMSFLYG